MDIKDAGVIQDLMKKGDPVRRVLAIKLRQEERLSLREIQKITGASKGSLSEWLRPYPLTKAERTAKMIVNHSGGRARKSRGERSKFRQMVGDRELSRREKADIAEAATLFRLTLHGLRVAKPVFDGAKTDWLVEHPKTRQLLKVQVKWVKDGRSSGLPTIKLRCTEGHNKETRYKNGDFDFIVGYDLHADVAYVYAEAEVEHLTTCVTVSPEAAERWDKLKK